MTQEPTVQPAAKTTRNREFEDQNIFAAIIFCEEPDVSIKQKLDAVAEMLTYNPDQSKEENQDRMEQFDSFCEYLRTGFSQGSIDSSVKQPIYTFLAEACKIAKQFERLIACEAELTAAVTTPSANTATAARRPSARNPRPGA